MFCGKCGKQLEDNAVVCPWCGEATGIEPKEKFVHQQENGGYGQNFDNRSNVNRDAAKPMTLLGISVGLMAMLIYYSGVISSVVLILVAGYVLLKEEDRWLRAVAAKAISIVCIFGAISGVIIMMENAFLASLLVLGEEWRMPIQDIFSSLNSIALFIRDFILLGAGTRALRYDNLRVGFIDRMINQNIQK
ncbi:zinc-ribbon domain-containing protein [Blautia sp. XA-2221]|uniref:zinc-ribbon domain-containing protein n=1 Tax=Blautia sp. XA-2221 TaxID=2903961 RepID=UPI0023784C9A|nr:zinc-ribbon domain-containing protein [Blautia sp. XA-2221]